MASVSFSGIASGIDGDAIIKQLIEARRTAAKPQQNRLDANEDETSSLKELQTKLLSLGDSMKDFLTLSGGSINKSATVSDTSALDVTVSATASASSMSVDVKQLAQTATAAFQDRFGTVDQPIAPGLSGEGKLTIQLGTATPPLTQEVTITNTTTLGELVSQVNNLEAGKLRAAAVNLGTETAPQYGLVIYGTESGLADGQISISTSSEIQGAGVLQGPNIQQAKDALISVPGFGVVSRPKNNISDLIPGVTLQLKKENSGPVQLTIGNDASKTSAKISKMVQALNDVIKQSKDESKIERKESTTGVSNTYGKLAHTRVDDELLGELRTAVSSTTGGVEGSSVNSMADLGVTINRDGLYEFKEQTFLDSVANDPIAADRLLNKLADKVAATGGVINLYSRSGGNIDVVLESNKEENSSINTQLQRLETSIEKQRVSLQRQFSNLESTVGKMNSQASALTSMLAGLGSGR